MAKRLIVLDYNAVRKAFDEEFKATRKLIESGETHLDNLAEGFTEADRVLRELSAVDAVEVSVLEKWLYEIAWNNVGNPLCESCEEIIRRLPGLRKFAEEYGERKEG